MTDPIERFLLYPTKIQIDVKQCVVLRSNRNGLRPDESHVRRLAQICFRIDNLTVILIPVSKRLECISWHKQMVAAGLNLPAVGTEEGIYGMIDGTHRFLSCHFNGQSSFSGRVIISEVFHWAEKFSKNFNNIASNALVPNNFFQCALSDNISPKCDKVLFNLCTLLCSRYSGLNLFEATSRRQAQIH